MRQAVGCRNCGGGITPDMPEGLCARCLLVPFDDGGAETWPGGDPSASEGGEPPLPQVPRYRVVRLVGTGGIGEVYEAEQDHPRRTVALKLLKGSAGGRETLQPPTY